MDRPLFGGRRGVRTLQSALMNDLQKIQGAWDVLRLEQDGKRAPDAPLVKMVIIKGDQLFLRYVFPRSGDFGDDMSRFKLDAMQTPKAIEQVVDSKRYRGIYDLEGDTLRIGWRRTVEANPPFTFPTHPGSHTTLLPLNLKQ